VQSDGDSLRVGIAQIAPVWLDRDATIDKVCTWIEGAARDGCELVALGEALVPGYPFWLERTDGARFESPLQKALHAHYLDQAVDLERGDLHRVQEAAADHGIHVCVGTIERPADRGGHSVYCTLVQVNGEGRIVVAHRKLMPTYEERLAWATGDGHGLRTTRVGAFTVGALNCWENWMPLPRAALYAQGEDLHVATWPGNVRNTQDITRFIAREGRSYVLSACALMRREDIGDALPFAEVLQDASDDVMANGGSCIAAPDGQWLVEPVADAECLIAATLHHGLVRRERQTFDPAGHYSRPDVTRLVVDRRRQGTAEFTDA
jgi:nitrilase